MTGIEVLRKLRCYGHEVPVIFLTALSDQMYEEEALIGGAVDFVEKSRSYTILKRRIELIMDGPKAQSAEATVVQDNNATFALGALTLDPDIGRADWGNYRINLTLTEFRIVHLLARQSGRYVRRDDLFADGRFCRFVVSGWPP